MGVGCQIAVCSRFAMAAACGATWPLLWELWFSCRSGPCRLCGLPPWFGVSRQLRTVRGFERAEIPDNRDVAATSTANRGQYVRRGQQLEYFTIAYNSLEGAASIIAGLLAGSVSLVGFGLDSLIEVASGAALLGDTTTTRTVRGVSKSSALRCARSERASLRSRCTSFSSRARR